MVKFNGPGDVPLSQKRWTRAIDGDGMAAMAAVGGVIRGRRQALRPLISHKNFLMWDQA
jgi:hypothetical protein